MFSKRTLSLLSAAVMLIGGVAMMGVGAWFSVDNARFISAARRAPGTVEHVVGQRGVRGQMLYYPVVRFRARARAGDNIFMAKPGLWPSPFEAGDEVTVAYDADDPDNAKIVSFWTLWFLPGVTFLFGIGCLFGAWHTYRKAV